MSAAPDRPQASSHRSAQHEGTAVSIDKLQGRWNIVSWTQDYDDGRVMKPMGDALEGFILYAPDGTMCCFIARADRPKFPSGLQFQASEAEKAQAYDGLMSYGGRYTVEGDAAPWRPLRAFDDGRKVYIEFPRGISQGEMPPLFVAGAAGDSQLVNYRVRGHHMIVDRLFAAAELRFGADPQKVVRIVRSDGRPSI